jgi:hypothetical protein
MRHYCPRYDCGHPRAGHAFAGPCAAASCACERFGASRDGDTAAESALAVFAGAYVDYLEAEADDRIPVEFASAHLRHVRSAEAEAVRAGAGDRVERERNRLYWMLLDQTGASARQWASRAAKTRRSRITKAAGD